MSFRNTTYKTILAGISLYALVTLPALFTISFTKNARAESIGLFLLSKDNPTYHKAADLTASLFKDKCSLPSCLSFSFKSVNTTYKYDDVRFVISYGTNAANLILEHKSDSPVIRAMLPKQIRLTNESKFKTRDILNLYIDQPLSRYFNLTKIIIPRATRAGILVHKSNSSLADQYKKIAVDYNLTLKIVFIDDDRIGNALSSMLDEIDALIALPDSRIHNSKTIPNILTTAYRNKIPVIGFSSAYTKAGAIASVYTSLDDIAKETAEAALELVNFNRFPAQRPSSKYYSVAVNHRVASSLGINISSEETIKNSMKSSKSE
jgi:ABC-type uncharacterized transport system substrate-binding protein